MKILKDFHELLEPQEETVGIHKGKWFVFAAHAQAALIAKGDSYSELGDATKMPLNPPSEFFFNSYDDAVMASILYYIPFGKRYPYDLQGQPPKSDTDDIVESQEMTF